MTAARPSTPPSSAATEPGPGHGFAPARPDLPDVLFDGMAVMRALSPEATRRTGADQVSDVLDAVVRLMRMGAEPAACAAPASLALSLGTAPGTPDPTAELVKDLQAQRDEADRCAGAALRELAGVKEELAALKRSRQRMKTQAGYSDTVSFDIVWDETLARAQAHGPRPEEGVA